MEWYVLVRETTTRDTRSVRFFSLMWYLAIGRTWSSVDGSHDAREREHENCCSVKRPSVRPSIRRSVKMIHRLLFCGCVDWHGATIPYFLLFHSHDYWLWLWITNNASPWWRQNNLPILVLARFHNFVTVYILYIPVMIDALQISNGRKSPVTCPLVKDLHIHRSMIMLSWKYSSRVRLAVGARTRVHSSVVERSIAVKAILLHIASGRDVLECSIEVLLSFSCLFFFDDRIHRQSL